jgi:[protein-PII] uridylyltransferase
VRTVDECVAIASSDVTVQTALLEARFLGGERKVFTAFQKAAAKAMDAKAFLRAKTLEMGQRHQKYENTPYSLEPNCKESPGGLRDLQTVIWVARAAGLGRTWQQLAAHGLITPFEVRQLQRNEGVLKLIRARLHMIAGRREDRLVFDLQTAVAESFGYMAAHGQRASERLMRRYYWAAKAVTQLNQILMLNIEERVNGLQDAPMRPINDKFLERGGMLEVASDDLYQRDPHAILETFLVYQQTVGPKGLSARTLRALYNARHLMDGKFRRDPVNHATFMKILQANGGQTHAFRLMNQTSVLGRYLWVFRRIVGQMQHDLFHVYTVDQHILMVMRNMRRFFIPEHAHEYPFCSQLASTFDRPWVLFIAALFHDVAKGRGGDHSVLGMREARRFCRDHGVGREDTQLIEFLVGQHLTMSRIAQKEDLSDPDVIAAFAKLIGSERRLTALYLLTVADIRGTSPKVWNAWKGKLLEDLYRLTLRALGGARPNLDAEIEATKLEARLLLNLASLPATAELPLWRTLQLSYFTRHEAGDIAWHTRSLIDLVDTPSPVVRARVSPLGEGLQVLVYAPDQQDLFARTCGYFDGAGFNILDAKVHTTTNGYALDTFLVVSPHIDTHYRDLIAYVETQLTLALKATGPLPEPSRGRLSRRVRSFPVTPRVTLRPDERAQHWLLGVSASDRSGLLYAISRVLANHNINLQLAKITTLGERVEDTFLIDGSALQQNKLQLQIESEMLDAISA